MSGAGVPDRYELKYVIPESQVEEVRAAIGPFCRLDAYSAAAPGHRYTIQSLYLDTRRLDLFRVARERRPRRFKLRVRGYGACPGAGPVFLEVKERIGALVRKSRARVDAGWATRLRCPVPRGAAPAELAFRDRLERYALEPVLLVRYDREAWESHLDGYARVTFDRRLEIQPWGRLDFDVAPSAWLPVDDPRTLRAAPRAVVLELKCTVDVPRWMARVAERLGLRRLGVSKYCHGVDRVWGSRALRHELASSPGGDLR